MHEPTRSRSGAGSKGGSEVAEAGAAADGAGAAVHGRFSRSDARGADGGSGGGEAGLVRFSRADQSKGRSGGARRDRSGVAGVAVVVRQYSRDWIGAGVGPAVPGERAVSLAVRRGGRESSDAVGFSHRSRRGAGSVADAGNRIAGGQGTGDGEPGESGRRTRAGERGVGKFSARGAAAKVVGRQSEARREVAAASGGAREAGGRSGEEESRAAASGRR